MGFPWANLPGGNALDAWDFLTDQARFNSVAVGPLANTPGWSFTRASTGHAQTSAGALTAFASGELRRTDKGVLIEGARTNLCLQSQTFDNASWTKGNGGVGSVAVVTADYASAPDGTTTADRVQLALNGGTSTSDISVIQQNLTVSSGAAYTVSFWAKSNTGASYVASFLNPASAANGITITPTWQRFTYTATTGGTSYAMILRLRGGIAPTCSDSADISLWGAQLEAGSFPSSYIPTTTASATRAADVLTVPVSGIDYPLSLYAEFERVVDTGGAECVFGANASSNERIDMRVSNVDLFQPLQVDGGSSVASPAVSGALAIGTVYKAAARFGLDSVQACRSGTLATEDTSATVPDAPTTITFGMRNSGSDPSFGYLRRAALWNRAISDAELQALTL